MVTIKESSKKVKRGEKQVHWPTLNTVIMVENTLRKIKEDAISIADLKRELPRQVNHIKLKIILEYLEKSNKIDVTMKGITWTENKSNSRGN